MEMFTQQFQKAKLHGNELNSIFTTNEYNYLRWEKIEAFVGRGPQSLPGWVLVDPA
jgi:hypothetical protein